MCNKLLNPYKKKGQEKFRKYLKKLPKCLEKARKSKDSHIVK